MPDSPKKILKTYWGYDHFRPLQEEIIHSVLENRDTLALLTTGGGKSICFQVPALCKEGICLVVSPLISLMKDQVKNLQERGIKAMAIFSGMTQREIDIALDNCIYGNYKFVYLSPERLKSELFLERLKKMNVNLIAIDESHCISQWGYDFRPSYLDIAKLRTQKPSVPFIALTATATLKVVKDIQSKLEFSAENVFRASFYRENLRYSVINHEDKWSKLIALVNEVKGSGIIYVRSRRLTVEYAHYLNARNISAQSYHAGLSVEERSKRQEAWINNEVRIMVATNAFGMGIDKPNVRFVINIDLPECLEAYFQEAGRGGRDGKKALALLLVDDSDRANLLSRSEAKFPDKDIIRRIYGLLANHYRIAIGAGLYESFSFDMDEFTQQVKHTFSKSMIHHSLQFLDRAGYIQLSEGYKNESRIKIESDTTTLYGFQVRHPKYDNVIKVLLRSYSGLFESFINIHEKVIAKRSKLSVREVTEILEELDELKLIAYVKSQGASSITFIQPRMDIKNIRLDRSIYDDLKQINIDNAKAMIDYAFSNTTCRSSMLLNYFGDNSAKDCGYCDICVNRLEKKAINATEFKLIQESIINQILDGRNESNDVVKHLSSKFSTENISKVLNWLVDNKQISIDQLNQLKINKK